MAQINSKCNLVKLANPYTGIAMFESESDASEFLYKGEDNLQAVVNELMHCLRVFHSKPRDDLVQMNLSNQEGCWLIFICLPPNGSKKQREYYLDPVQFYYLVQHYREDLSDEYRGMYACHPTEAHACVNRLVSFDSYTEKFVVKSIKSISM